MQVQIAEEAVARAQSDTSAVGTIVSVQSDALLAQVVFDGSGGAIPCLVGAHVSCVDNDRVGLQKFGSEWVVMVNLGNLRWPGAAGYSAAASTGTAPVGSWSNLPGSPSFTFTKRWDTTTVRWAAHIGCFTTVLGTSIQVGISYNAGSTTIKCAHYTFANNGGDPALDAHSFGGAKYESGLLAGTYTVVGRWQSDANIQCSSDDWVSLEGIEVAS
jgi:hypothetical protein